MIPSASMTCCPGATSRDEEVAYGAFCAGFPSLDGALRRLTVSNRSRARVALCAVAASGLKPSQAVSKSAATLTNRSGEGASCCALRATSSKHGPRGPEADMGSGDESPREMKSTYASSEVVSSGTI